MNILLVPVFFISFVFRRSENLCCSSKINRRYKTEKHWIRELSFNLLLILKTDEDHRVCLWFYTEQFNSLWAHFLLTTLVAFAQFQMNFSPAEKFQQTLHSYGTVQHFHPIHKELWTARHLNFLTVKVVRYERNTLTQEFSTGQKFVWCRVKIALGWNMCALKHLIWPGNSSECIKTTFTLNYMYTGISCCFDKTLIRWHSRSNNSTLKVWLCPSYSLGNYVYVS